ncbi:MAG: CARDB domain-containing protein, partial [Candidatus Poseidoniales archaeon]
MATPATAGASVLVREYIMEIAERPAPQGALIKAMLILGAEDMGTRDIPNVDEGWGRINLVNTLIPDEDIGIFVDDRSRLSSGQVNEYTFDVTRAGEPLKVVVAWSDYPGSSSSSIQLRNDLDLEVVSPNGQITYLGNDFNNGRSTTGGSKDNRNNVEVVLIDSATTGIWTVKVRDAQHGGSRTYQPYSIAVRGVNVNDLTPDPTFIAGSFEISTPIPQVGEEVEILITIQNQGAGSFTGIPVTAYANSNPIGTQTISMSPGGSEELTWYWTPISDDEGEVEISFYIDPNDSLEEL